MTPSLCTRIILVALIGFVFSRQTAHLQDNSKSVTTSVVASDSVDPLQRAASSMDSAISGMKASVDNAILSATVEAQRKAQDMIDAAKSEANTITVKAESVAKAVESEVQELQEDAKDVVIEAHDTKAEAKVTADQIIKDAKARADSLQEDVKTLKNKIKKMRASSSTLLGKARSDAALIIKNAVEAKAALEKQAQQVPRVQNTTMDGDSIHIRVQVPIDRKYVENKFVIATDNPETAVKDDQMAPKE